MLVFSSYRLQLLQLALRLPQIAVLVTTALVQVIIMISVLARIAIALMRAVLMLVLSMVMSALTMTVMIRSVCCTIYGYSCIIYSCELYEKWMSTVQLQDVLYIVPYTIYTICQGQRRKSGIKTVKSTVYGALLGYTQQACLVPNAALTEPYTQPYVYSCFFAQKNHDGMATVTVYE